jgi:transposase InsO family protein
VGPDRARGKPRDNVYIETFNGSPRDECLNIHWFRSIAEARRRSRPGGGTIMIAVLTRLLVI